MRDGLIMELNEYEDNEDEIGKDELLNILIRVSGENEKVLNSYIDELYGDKNIKKKKEIY